MKSDDMVTMAPAALDLAAIIKMGVLAALWGLSIPITKIGLIDLPPMVMTAARFMVATALLLVLAYRAPVPPPRVIARLFMLGIVGIGIGQVSQTIGVVSTTASVATIISATIPIFVVIFAAMKFRQSVSKRQALGLATSFAGIGLIALDGQNAGLRLSTQEMIGSGLVLLSAVAIAWSHVWSADL